MGSLLNRIFHGSGELKIKADLVFTSLSWDKVRGWRVISRRNGTFGWEILCHMKYLLGTKEKIVMYLSTIRIP